MTAVPILGRPSRGEAVVARVIERLSATLARIRCSAVDLEFVGGIHAAGHIGERHHGTDGVAVGAGGAQTRDAEPRRPMSTCALRTAHRCSSQLSLFALRVRASVLFRG